MTDYPWMQNVCFEPAPIRRRSNRALHIALTLCVIAIATGALLALN